jgi:hypothetical protein
VLPQLGLDHSATLASHVHSTHTHRDCLPAAHCMGPGKSSARMLQSHMACSPGVAGLVYCLIYLSVECVCMSVLCGPPSNQEVLL